MANKRYDQFTAGTPATTDITLFANPSTGTLKKCALSALPQSINPCPIAIQVLQPLGCPILATAVGALPYFNNNQGTTVNHSIYFVYVPCGNITATGIWFISGFTAVYTANNFNGFALYSQSAGTLTRIAITANDATPFKSTLDTFVQVPFVTPVSLIAGAYWIAYIWSASAVTAGVRMYFTAPSIAHGASLLNLSNTGKIAGRLDTQTTLPTSIAFTAFGDANLAPTITGLY